MFRNFATAGLALAMAVQPVCAASLDPVPASPGHQVNGAFGGARLRLSFGAAPRASAALALAPTQQAVAADGTVRTRFGEGLTLGAGRGEPVSVRLAGTRVDRLGLARNGRLEENGRRHGISTVGYVAIGVGVAVIIGGLLFVDAVRDSSE